MRGKQSQRIGLVLAAAVLLVVTDAQAQKNEGHSVLNRPTGGHSSDDSGPLPPLEPPKLKIPPPAPWPPLIGKPAPSSKSEPEKK